MVDGVRKMPPRGSVIHAIARYERSFEVCLYELIDNCINAGARWIRITSSTKKGDSFLRIEDDGKGCSNLYAIIALGERVEQPDNANGFWGIGGTEACIIIGGSESTCAIRSVHDNVSRNVTVRWREVADSDWGYPETHDAPCAAGEVGTSITVQPLNKTAKSWENLSKLIAERYWPALTRAGGPVQILLRTPKDKIHQPVIAPEFPRLLPGAVDSVIKFGHYEARVVCGIVPTDAKNTAPGFTYFMFPRVIRSNVSDGAGDHSIAQISARVELVKGWSKGGLSAFKQEFDAADRLYQEVESCCESVLRKGDALGQSIELVRFNQDVTDLLGDMMGRPRKANPNGRDAKAVRVEGDEEGTVEPSGRGGRHGRADKEQPGDTFKGRDGDDGKNGRLKVTHAAQGGQSAGTVTEREIVLNLDRPLIAAAFKERDSRLSAVVALSLWNEYRAFNPKRSKRRWQQPQQPVLDMNDPEAAKSLSVSLGLLLDGYSRAVTVDSVETGVA